MSRQTLKMLVAELFVATLKSLLRQICLDLSHFSSIFCRDNVFSCHDRDFCLQFFIVLRQNFMRRNILLVILLNFCRDNKCLCRDIVLLNLKLSLSRHKLLCHDQVFLPFNVDFEFCVMTKFSFVATKLFYHLQFFMLRQRFEMSRQSSTAICLDQCRNRKIFCRDKVLSPVFLYVSTLISLSQHLCNAPKIP